MNRDRLNNDEPTATTLAASLAGFISYVKMEEQSLRSGREALPQLSGTPLVVLTNACLDLEASLKREKSEMLSNVENILRDANDHLLCHHASVESASLRTIKELWSSDIPLVPKALPPERLERYEAIVDITWKFLVRMGVYTED